MKNDLRVIKTKKNLYEALITLMKEKTFEEIKVADICKKALINRSTFYNHYQDKYELLYELINNRTLFTERYLKDSFDDFVYILSADEKVKVNSYLENIDKIKLNLVSGDELLRRNIKPGENFGRALRDINRLVIEGMNKEKAIGVILKEFSEK